MEIISQYGKSMERKIQITDLLLMQLSEGEGESPELVRGYH